MIYFSRRVRLCIAIDKYTLHDKLFDLDSDKNLSNIPQNGVQFKEAATVFLNPYAILVEDREISENEERLILFV